MSSMDSITLKQQQLPLRQLRNLNSLTRYLAMTWSHGVSLELKQLREAEILYNL